VPMLLKDLGCHVAGEQTTTARRSCAMRTSPGPPTATWQRASERRGWSRWAGRTCPSSGRP
jgi:hypothetical protein